MASRSPGFRKIGVIFGLATALGCAAGTAPPEIFRGDDRTAEAAGPGVSGTVWAPNNGPGDVPAGREVPVSGALVRLVAGRPDPIPDHVHCRSCLQSTGILATFSDAAGHFTIDDIEPGEYWLVIEAGPFRRDVQVVVESSDHALRIDDDDTELPSYHDAETGRFAPRVALLSGAFDPAGHWLGQLGLGGLDAEGAFVADPNNDRVEVFYNGGRESRAEAEHAHDLLRDPERLSRFHVLVVPSSDSGSFTDALAMSRDEEAIRSLRDWVRAGGVVVASGESSRLVDTPWPAALELDPTQDVPAAAYEPLSDRWRTAEVPPPGVDTEPYDSSHARAVDSALAAWLAEQRGPGYALYHWGPDGEFVGPDARLVGDYDPNDLPILGSTAIIEAVRPLGPEEMPPRVLLEGANGAGDLMRGPLAVTMQPPGCGRVMYATAPLSIVSPPELTVMERIAFYFLVNTPICARPPI